MPDRTAAIVIAVLVTCGAVSISSTDVRSAPAGRTSPAPDVVADYAGGIAARLRTADGRAVDGDLFLLMATAGSDVRARVYEETPLTHDNGVAPDVVESNAIAVATVETVWPTDVDVLEFTAAPGGGPSGGITYVIAYLNVLTNGAFTGELRVAATGELDADGYVGPVEAIAEKTAAAHLAGVDVLFTSVFPETEVADMHAGRLIGEMFRARDTPAPLAEERNWTSYRTWGETRRADGMDVVGVHHVGDVAAYLCGAGSDTACTVLGLLDATDAATVAATRPHGGGSRQPASGDQAGVSVPVR